MMTETHAGTSRREFLTVLAASGCAAVCGAGLPACADVIVAAGNISGLAEGTLRAVAGAPLAIGRDVDGVYALTAICTHLNCDMTDEGTIDANGLICDCHDSAFDVDGAVTSDPATIALDNYDVTIDDDGEITIDTGSVVAAGTRVAVATT
jgi:Rieske Fe-S protein